MSWVKLGRVRSHKRRGAGDVGIWDYFRETFLFRSVDCKNKREEAAERPQILSEKLRSQAKNPTSLPHLLAWLASPCTPLNSAFISVT